MHFKSYAEIKNLHPDTKIWPIGIFPATPLVFKYDRNRVTERHTCDIPLKNGHTGTAIRCLIPTVGGGWLNVCVAAYRAIERVLKHCQPEELDHLDVAVAKAGGGMNTYYDAYPLYNDGHDDARHLGVLRGKADFNHVTAQIGDQALTRLEEKRRATCRCDIRDLLSTGHNSGCVERK